MQAQMQQQIQAMQRVQVNNEMTFWLTINSYLM